MCGEAACHVGGGRRRPLGRWSVGATNLTPNFNRRQELGAPSESSSGSQATMQAVPQFKQHASYLLRFACYERVVGSAIGST
jgi:hypothetical protein